LQKLSQAAYAGPIMSNDVCPLWGLYFWLGSMTTKKSENISAHINAD